MKKILRGSHSQIDPDVKNTPTSFSPIVQNSLQQKSDQFVCIEESRKCPHLPHDSIHFQN